MQIVVIYQHSKLCVQLLVAANQLVGLDKRREDVFLLDPENYAEWGYELDLLGENLHVQLLRRVFRNKAPFHPFLLFFYNRERGKRIEQFLLLRKVVWKVVLNQLTVGCAVDVLYRRLERVKKFCFKQLVWNLRLKFWQNIIRDKNVRAVEKREDCLYCVHQRWFYQLRMVVLVVYLAWKPETLEHVLVVVPQVEVLDR